MKVKSIFITFFINVIILLSATHVFADGNVIGGTLNIDFKFASGVLDIQKAGEYKIFEFGDPIKNISKIIISINADEVDITLNEKYLNTVTVLSKYANTNIVIKKVSSDNKHDAILKLKVIDKKAPKSSESANLKNDQPQETTKITPLENTQPSTTSSCLESKPFQKVDSDKYKISPINRAHLTPRTNQAILNFAPTQKRVCPAESKVVGYEFKNISQYHFTAASKSKIEAGAPRSVLKNNQTTMPLQQSGPIYTNPGNKRHSLRPYPPRTQSKLKTDAPKAYFKSLTPPVYYLTVVERVPLRKQKISPQLSRSGPYSSVLPSSQPPQIVMSNSRKYQRRKTPLQQQKDELLKASIILANLKR